LAPHRRGCEIEYGNANLPTRARPTLIEPSVSVSATGRRSRRSRRLPTAPPSAAWRWRVPRSRRFHPTRKPHPGTRYAASAMKDTEADSPLAQTRASSGLVIGLEPSDLVLPSRLDALEDRPSTKLKEDGRAIGGGDPGPRADGDGEDSGRSSGGSQRRRMRNRRLLLEGLSLHILGRSPSVRAV
jgi:hypothetical protein